MRKPLLLLVAAAACVVALPSGGTLLRSLTPAKELEMESDSNVPPPLRSHKSLNDLMYPSLFLPLQSLLNKEDNDAQETADHDWVNKEIEHINKMGNNFEGGIPNYEMESSMVVQDNYMDGPSFSVDQTVYSPDGYRTAFFDLRKTNSYANTDKQDLAPESYQLFLGLTPKIRKEQRKKFALTPLDKEYFDGIRWDNNKIDNSSSQNTTKSEYNSTSYRKPSTAMLITQRETRQNPIPNGKQKHLLEPDLSKLSLGLANKDYRFPVSLLPSNLQWLKNRETDDLNERSPDIEEQQNNRVIQKHFTGIASNDAIYSVIIIAAAGAALTMVIFGFAYGLYILTKRAKAAADVDYPAYGVTGPQVDTSGDRKLAQNAHMYHYQHQKQQILAMERNGVDQRNGSVTDPESEEENEEGDYTVYECPGFATTGDMEVKNPLFSDEPTPATPGKNETVQLQAKEQNQ